MNWKLDIGLHTNGKLDYYQTYIVTAATYGEAIEKGFKLAGRPRYQVTVFAKPQPNDDGFDNGCQ